MRYAGIIKNDTAAAPGICVSFFTQGCPFHCKGCHNPETWDFDGGKEFTQSVLDEVLAALTANGIQRNFCIMGGEPLCEQNVPLTLKLIKEVRTKLPSTQIYVWTGFRCEFLNRVADDSSEMSEILTNIDYLIDGRYEEDKRDITLKMRGSSNQRIIQIYRTK